MDIHTAVDILALKGRIMLPQATGQEQVPFPRKAY